MRISASSPSMPVPGSELRGLRWLPGLLWMMLAGAATLPVAHAAMQVDRTRVILTENAAKATVNVSSADALPLLLQVWVEPGQDGGYVRNTGSIVTPFIADPPVLRLDPGESRALQVRRVHLPETLPQDRESQFWLCLLEIPAVRQQAGKEAGQKAGQKAAAPRTAAGAVSTPTDRLSSASLKVSVRTRIKLFYRPAQLATYRAHNSADRLRFVLERDGQLTEGRAGAWLTIHNPAPIHQSLNSLTLHQGKTQIPVPLGAAMVAPFGQMKIRLPAATPIQSAGLWIKAVTVDDHGSLIDDAQDL